MKTITRDAVNTSVLSLSNRKNFFSGDSDDWIIEIGDAKLNWQYM